MEQMSIEWMTMRKLLCIWHLREVLNIYVIYIIVLLNFYITAHEKIVELLAENGADVNSTDLFGDTPLHSVIYKSSKHDTSKLLFWLEIQRDEFKPIYYHLIKLESVKLVEYLLKHGGNVTIVNRRGKTPLHYAAENGLNRNYLYTLHKEFKSIISIR